MTKKVKQQIICFNAFLKKTLFSKQRFFEKNVRKTIKRRKQKTWKTQRFFLVTLKKNALKTLFSLFFSGKHRTHLKLWWQADLELRPAGRPAGRLAFFFSEKHNEQISSSSMFRCTVGAAKQRTKLRPDRFFDKFYIFFQKSCKIICPPRALGAAVFGPSLKFRWPQTVFPFWFFSFLGNIFRFGRSWRGANV